jgi:mRNA interferase MazF
VVIQRGEIWWAALPSPSGSEPGYKRPILIVQSDDFNRSQIRTVIAIVITSNLRLSDAPGNVFLPRKSSGLPKDSVVNASQLVTIDKSFLIEKAGGLRVPELQDVEAGIRLVLSL